MDNYTLSSPYLSDQSMNNPIVPSTNRSIPPQTPPPAPSNGTRISLTNNIPLRTSLPGKHCWVCFATDEDDFSACWVSPCRCRGTAKWVHQECLQRWVDEKQQGSSGVKVACPQCNTEYIIVYPKQGPLVYTLDLIERILNRFCPFLAGGILVGSVYWTAVTYGAVTIMQILGHKEGLTVMEKADPLFLLIGLPTIPIVLILGRMIRWEEAVLKFWRKHSSKLPLMNYLFPNDRTPYLPRVPTERNGNSNPASLTRLICGGLILPTIATIFGKFMFQRVHSNFQRTLLGGIAFIVLKGTAKIYYKQSQYIREAHREILNYESTTVNPSHYHPHHPAPPAHPPTTTVEVHQSENSNEIFVIPSSPSIPTDQSPLNF
jgi:E3 ubiquitin-protein ligase MARCH5